MSAIREQFVRDSVAGYPAYKYPGWLHNVWNKTLAYEKSIGKTLDEGFTREDFIGLFQYLHPGKASTFVSMKMPLVYYLRYLVSHGALPQANLETLQELSVLDVNIKDSKQTYFIKNLVALRAAIEDTIHVGVAEKPDDTMYDAQASVLYLAWFGFTLQEICDLKKSDVLLDGVMRGGVKIEMPKYAMFLINRYKESAGIKTQGRGEIFAPYQYSEYLVRTKAAPHLDVPTVKMALYRFNRVTDKQYALSYQRVRDSGIFFRAYALEQNMALNDEKFDLKDRAFVARVFETEEETLDKAKLARIKRDYTRYKQLFS